jgi:hypothetical protein
LLGSRSLRTTLLLLILVVSSLVAAQAASAGTYTVNACSPTNSTGGWQPVNTFPSGLTVGNMCGGPASGPNEPQGPTDEGALFAQDGPTGTAETPNGAEAGWSFAAPAGTSIASLTYWRSLHAYDQQSLVPGLWTGEGATLESCQSPPEGTHECNDLNNQGPKAFPDLNTSSLFFGVRCNLVGGGEYCASSGGTNHFAQADLYSASVTLSEASSPTVSSVSGAAWNGGYLLGQVPLILSASDYSGIADVEVRSALGAVLANVPQACDYYSPVPCPNLSGTTIDLNTAAAQDGPQSILVVVRDAADNITRVSSRPVTIDNHGPAAPAGLTATLSGKEVILSWQNPAAAPVSIASAAVSFCSAICTPTTTVSPTGVAHFPAPAPGIYTVHLSLIDAAGKTSPPATVPLAVPPTTPLPPTPKLEAILGAHGRLYIAGPISKGVSTARVCWRSQHGKRTLGSRCVTLHVKHQRIAVTFHPSVRARRGRITVTVSHGHRLIARLTAKRHTRRNV